MNDPVTIDVEGYCSRKDMASYLGISLKTLDRLVVKGMPSVLVGGQRRFLVAKVEEWLEDGEDRPDPRSEIYDDGHGGIG